MEAKKMTDSWMDAAATDAIGAHTAAESAAYAQELAGAGTDAQELDQDLRDAVGRLAAASPYMAPSADLRGRILAATAPATFKMEDYRKATRDNSSFYRWGFYAAMLFLMAGAAFNIFAQNALKQSNAKVAALENLQQQQTLAMTTLMSPQMQPVSFMQDGGVMARGFFNQATGKGVLIVPNGTAVQGSELTMSLPVGGKNVAFNTMVIGVPSEFIGSSIEKVRKMQNLSPDTAVRPMTAGQ